MKKLLLILLCLPMIGFGQNVNIPDTAFKVYLVGNSNINTNGDNEIQLSEANSFNGSIICNNNNISDLTGIENFTSLTKLDCSWNQLSILDVSQNPVLTHIDCHENNIISLDLSQNTSLTNLNCSANQLQSLDVSQNNLLTVLVCEFNSITALDVTQNIYLTNLGFAYNQIDSINLTQNAELTHLNCAANNLQTLNLDQNILLTYLRCYSNQLNSLDVSDFISLDHLYCNDNQLISLDVKNGNNTNFIDFNINFNPNLYCINVDDSAWSTTNWTNIDPQHYFSNNCSGTTSITEQNTTKELFKVTDLLGRESKQTNQPLLYLYDDGTVEKRITID